MRSLKLLLTVLLCSFLLSCSKDDNDSGKTLEINTENLVGEWSYDRGKGWVLSDTGSKLTIDQKGQAKHNTLVIILKNDMSGQAKTPGESEQFTYTLQNKTLTLNYDDSETDVFTVSKVTSSKLTLKQQSQYYDMTLVFKKRK